MRPERPASLVAGNLAVRMARELWRSPSMKGSPTGPVPVTVGRYRLVAGEVMRVDRSPVWWLTPPRGVLYEPVVQDLWRDPLGPVCCVIRGHTPGVVRTRNL